MANNNANFLQARSIAECGVAVNKITLALLHMNRSLHLYVFTHTPHTLQLLIEIPKTIDIDGTPAELVPTLHQQLAGTDWRVGINDALSS